VLTPDDSYICLSSSPTAAAYAVIFAARSQWSSGNMPDCGVRGLETCTEMRITGIPWNPRESRGMGENLYMIPAEV